jgi:hypothetical protein
MFAQCFQPQRLKCVEISLANRSDRNIVGQITLLPILLNGVKRMSTLSGVSEFRWFNLEGGSRATRRSGP